MSFFMKLFSNSNIEDGAYIETDVNWKKLNVFQQVQYSMPFHTMKLETYEARLKKFVY